MINGNHPPNLSAQHIDRIIEMAWEDRTPFEAITFQFGLSERDVIDLMRREMKASSFRMWRTSSGSLYKARQETQR